MCDMTHPYVRHDQSMRATRLDHIVWYFGGPLCTQVQKLELNIPTHTHKHTNTHNSQHTTTHTHMCTHTRVPAHTQTHTCSLILSRVHSLVLSFALALYLTHSVPPSPLTPLARSLPYSLSLALSLHELGHIGLITVGFQDIETTEMTQPACF